MSLTITLPRRLPALVLLSTLAACAPRAGAGPAEPPAAQAMLQAPLELREGQGGFAGTSGLVWRVSPDGSYSVARFLNQNEQPPHHSGRLPPERLAALAQALRDARLEELPATLGTYKQANPHTTELRYGAQRVVVTGPPGEPAPGTPAGPPAQARVARLVALLKAQLPPEAR